MFSKLLSSGVTERERSASLGWVHETQTIHLYNPHEVSAHSWKGFVVSSLRPIITLEDDDRV